jgi:hypothetical protein
MPTPMNVNDLDHQRPIVATGIIKIYIVPIGNT